MSETTPTPVTGTVFANGLTRRQVLTVLGGLMVGLLLSALDSTIVATALPTIAGKLGGLEHIAWVATAYLLASTAATPILGKLSDLYGRRPIFQFAILVFLVGSLLCAVAQSFLQLVIFRGVQGIGGGGLMSMAFIIIGDLIPPRDRGRYTGFFTSVFALSSIIGPLIGGFFVDNLTWRWIFTINLPIGIVALFVTSKALRLPHVKREHKIDWQGAVLMVAAVMLLILAATWGGHEYAWGSATIRSMVGAGLVVLGVFIWWERRAVEPLIPMRLFANPVVFSTDSFLPLFMQAVTGASATRSGLLLMPLMLGVTVGSVGSGRLVSIWGRYKVFPVVGLGCAFVAVLLFTRLGVNTHRTYVSVVQVLMGFGIGMTMPTTTTAVQNAVDGRDIGVASALAQFMRSFGGACGLAGYGAVFASKITSRLPPELAKSVEDPHGIAKLAPEVRTQVVSAIASGVRSVYVWALPAVGIAWVAMMFLREVPLRRTAGLDRAAEAHADADAAAREQEPVVVPGH
jgi:EmrB/QacA subfamily drug resistance transporter